MNPDNRSIGELAYRLWQSRGCPDGTAEEDWLEAERQLIGDKQPVAVATIDTAPSLSETQPPITNVSPQSTTPREGSTRSRAVRSRPVATGPSSDRPI
jgi:Protein of unknown function (DUF2934)